MKIDWKRKLSSRRTLGRLIRFQLLLTLLFGSATIILLLIPLDGVDRSRSALVPAKAVVKQETLFRYPFPVYRELPVARPSLYEFGEVRQEFADLLTVEEEPPPAEEKEVVEETEQEEELEPEPPPPIPTPDLEGLALVGTLTGVDGVSIAIIRDDNLGETVYVMVGDDLNGSVVQEIYDNSVLVVLGDEEEELIGASYQF